MSYEMTSAMREAMELVRAGDLAAATQLIQSRMNGPAEPAPDDAASRSANESAVPERQPPARGRRLGATLADLAAKLPGKDGHKPVAREPVLPDGARFDHGAFTSAAGSREYRIYIPRLTGSPPAGLIMMLHGCTQSPVDFALGTDMNRLADDQGLIVVYPAQSRGANMQSCWNWFAPTDQDRGGGEPAILAELAEKIARDHDIPRDRLFAAGLSAGGAMAVILGRTYPDVFAAVGAHSGLPYKSAHDVQSAFAAMGGGQNGLAGHRVGGKGPVPTIVFHGTADATVKPVNGQRIADEVGASGAEIRDRGRLNGRGYACTTILSEAGNSGGHSVLEHWQIEGLGHAWSGGRSGGSYTDPAGPVASAEMVRFFLAVARTEG